MQSAIIAKRFVGCQVIVIRQRRSGQHDNPLSSQQLRQNACSAGDPRLQQSSHFSP